MKTLRLWIEAARESRPGPAGEETGIILRSLSTETRFLALMAHGEGWMAPPARAALLAAWEALSLGADLEVTSERLLAALPVGTHLPWAVLHSEMASVVGCRPVQLLECDAPPVFYARRGEVVFLPVFEEETHGRLLRRCKFDVQDGDHLALVSESYIRACGGARAWNWSAIALSVRRLTAIGGSAVELAGALVRLVDSRWQIADGRPMNPQSAVSVLAMRVRPMRSVTVWTGPPGSPSVPPAAARERERAMLARLMAEEGTRIICGDTTAAIAARLLGAQIEMERQPASGWREVPPVSQIVAPNGSRPVALVTEGVITLRAAAERLALTQEPRDLLGREDGASRLAKLLLEADMITFLVGLAVNPAQTEQDGTPLRKVAVEKLAAELRAQGKIVSVVQF